MLLTGEAGIGKSRLAVETTALAARRGFGVLEGRADPLQAGLAYAPVVEALRPRLAAMTAPHAARVLDGLTDLGRLFTHPALPGQLSAGDPELDRIRMFEAVVQLFQRLAEQQPTVLFVDDLHWADSGTVELVHYIGRSTSGQRLLVLASYRVGELTGLLGDLAADVRRRDPDAELTLAPLAGPAVAQLIGDLLGAEPAPSMVRGVTERTGGVPLFVTALVQSGAESALESGQLPVIVRDVVLGRLQRLGEDERRLLEIVAVAGEGASEDVLRAVWLSGDFDAQLGNLIASGLVVERESGRSLAYRVGHPLYAEVAYAELTAKERRGMHAALATAIDSVRADDVLALAPHYLGAGDLLVSQRAIDILAEAGWRAIRVTAYGEAVRYLSAALAETRTAGPDEAIVELLYGLTRALMCEGRIAEVVPICEEGAVLAERCGTTSRSGWFRYLLAVHASESGNSTLAEPHLGTGIPLMSDTYDDLAMRLTFELRHGDSQRLALLAAQLTSAADHDSSPHASASAHIGQEITALLAGDFAAAKREAQQARDLTSSDTGFPLLLERATRDLIGLSVLAGDAAAAVRHAEHILRTEMRFGPLLAQCSARFSLSIARYLAGDAPAALLDNDRGLEVSRRISVGRSLARTQVTRAFLLAELGRSGEAATVLAKAVDGFGTGWQTDGGLRALRDLAQLALALTTGVDAAAGELSDGVVIYEPAGACLMLLFEGRAAIASADLARAAAATDRLRTIGRTAPFPDTLADRLTGLRLAAIGDPDAAADLLRSSADRTGAMGMPALAAQTRLELAELAIGDDERREIVVSCHQIFQQAGAVLWLDRCRRLARSAGLTLGSSRRTGPLTKRETQVVELVGEGLTNADIAARLFLSERTVEAHLRHSYARLGLTTRVALARWAAENIAE
ncbi:helix-turn-helix transcriptional regulator [Fodinicola feengrottensis]|uniref:Helix-turn-helix transcriptional regulator n=2 Tax=Fodinicola feengrottensis TaxID=435914 RepID=A0ABN2HC85_9ACTN